MNDVRKTGIPKCSILCDIHLEFDNVVFVQLLDGNDFFLHASIVINESTYECN